MFRKLQSVLIPVMAVASVCLVTGLGCSRQEQVEVHEETVADESRPSGSAAGKNFATADADRPNSRLGNTGSSALTALNPLPEESLRFVAPEGWSEKQVSGLQRVAFVISEGDRTAEVTAICLPGAVSELLLNVNRWRRQIGLESTTQEDLDAALEAIDVNGRSGRYIALTGPADAEGSKSMLVVLVDEPNPTWFFRMLGDSELVLREQERFEAFVKSVTFAAVPEEGEEVSVD